MQAPEFWTRGKGGIRSAMLSPLGWFYGQATAVRLRRGHPWRAPVKVLCVGNLIAGGAGKTR